MLLPFQGDHHMHEITQGAAALYPGLLSRFTGKPLFQ